MKITSLKFKNFRSYNNVTFDFSDPSFYDSIGNTLSSKSDFLVGLMIAAKALLNVETVNTDTPTQEVPVPSDSVSGEANKGSIMAVARSEDYEIMEGGKRVDLSGEDVEMTVEINLIKDRDSATCIFDSPRNPGDKRNRSMRLNATPEAVSFGSNQVATALIL